MLLDKYTKITVHGKTIKYFNDKGYSCKNNDMITVLTLDLPEGTHVKVNVKCDYCGKEFEKKYYHYCESHKYSDKDACKSCCRKKNSDVMLKKYGITAPLQIKEVQEKVKETCEERYGKGITNVMQSSKIQEKLKNSMQEKYGVSYVGQIPEVKEKQKKTMLEKYGVENAFCNGPLREASYQKALKTKCERGTMPVSINQQHICDLYGLKPNIYLEHYIVDMLFENLNIYCEYDGAGHQLCVDLGQISQEDFDKKEKQRYHILKRHGYKVLRIKHLNKRLKLPSDDILLQIKEIGLHYLQQENHYWIIFDIDNNKIITKEKEINWDYIHTLSEITQIGEL